MGAFLEGKDLSEIDIGGWFGLKASLKSSNENLADLVKGRVVVEKYESAEEPIPQPSNDFNEAALRSAIVMYYGKFGEKMLRACDEIVEATGENRAILKPRNIRGFSTSYIELVSRSSNVIHIENNDNVGSTFGFGGRSRHPIDGAKDFWSLCRKNGNLYARWGEMLDPNEKFDDYQTWLKDTFLPEVAGAAERGTDLYFNFIGFLNAGVEVVLAFKTLSDPEETSISKGLAILPYLGHLAKSIKFVGNTTVEVAAYTADNTQILRQANKGGNNLQKLQLLSGLGGQWSNAALDRVKRFLFCFAEGTPVRVSSGFVPIEQLNFGQQVLSWDECSGKNSLNAIDYFRRSISNHLYTLKFKDDQIRCTGEHPFYTIRQGVRSWVHASSLNPGDILVTHAGKTRTLLGKYLTLGQFPVISIGVAENPTYYVGHIGVLTHNAKCVKEVYEATIKVGGNVKNLLNEVDPKTIATWLSNAKERGYISRLMRRLDSGKHEWIPLKSLIVLFDRASDPKVIEATINLIDKARSSTKAMWFTAKKGKFGHVGSGRSTATHSIEFHNRLNAAFEGTFSNMNSIGDFARFKTEWKDQVEDVIKEFFKGKELERYLGQLKEW